MKLLLSLTVISLGLSIGFLTERSMTPQTSAHLLPHENHLRNLKQLTFGGDNAEAYFSSDGKKLIFQSTRDGQGCDQIYSMNADGSDVKMLSNGEGRTTCSYIFPANK